VTVSSRLKKYCKEKGITQKSLIDKGFGTSQTINNYINGHTEPKANFLENFIKEFRVSAQWLMTGQEDPGGKYTPHSDTKDCPECKENKKSIDELKDKLAEVQEKYTHCLEELLGKKEIQVKNSA
jgi:transcriptional regulator with XRE-family HTH domain